MVTRLLIELTLLRVLPAVAFGGVFYSMMGLRREPAAFASFLVAAALASADSALLCAAIFACAPRQAGAAALVATMALLVCLLLSGFQINLASLPPALEWLGQISFARHAFEWMIVAELDGQLVAVDVPGAPSVRIKAHVLLGALGLADRPAENLTALLAIGGVLIVITSLVVALQMGRWRN